MRPVREILEEEERLRVVREPVGTIAIMAFRVMWHDRDRDGSLVERLAQVDREGYMLTGRVAGMVGLWPGSALVVTLKEWSDMLDKYADPEKFVDDLADALAEAGVTPEELARAVAEQGAGGGKAPSSTSDIVHEAVLRFRAEVGRRIDCGAEAVAVWRYVRDELDVILKLSAEGRC